MRLDGFENGSWEFYRRGGGTPSDIHHRIQCARFIPADAGNTHECRFRPCFYPVYPRWRGEHSAGPFQIHNRFGLSPLARGTRNDISINNYNNRFIPAGAGNTPHTDSPNGGEAVYPRWRGEHSRAKF